MRNKESEWREIVSKFELSGLSQREFSAREGIIKSRLSYWVLKFKKSSPKSNFVELPKSTALLKKSPLLELSFPNGLTLKIRG